MGKKDRKKRTKGTDRIKIDYWQSYSDVMAALLLVFILILFASIQKINVQQQEIEKKRIELEQQTLAAQESMKKLEELIGVKAEIIEELKKELKGHELIIDEKTGSILFDSSIMFDTDKSVLKRKGKKELDEFLDVYLKVLLSDKFSHHIAEIIVEGHTDTDGTYEYNLGLSQERALTVVKYCLKSNEIDLTRAQRKELRNIITASGRSYSNPVYNQDGTINMDKSRRVVFQFRLKDEEMINQLRQILSNS